MNKHYQTFLRWLQAGLYKLTDEGILINDTVMARGTYYPFIDGEPCAPEHNLVPLEGLRYFLLGGLKGGTIHTAWHLAIFSGAVNPAANWTAANFSSNASEITSSTEGYSNATRPIWTPDGNSVGSLVGNLADKAAYNIVCTTNINIAGAALLSSSTKGGTTGTLVSASRFDNVHTVNNGSTFELGYEVELTDS